MIHTVIPTRGLIFAQTLQSLADNGIYKPIIIDGLSIPESHNAGVRKALDDSPSHILFVEDDMVVPPGAVEAMMRMDKPIVAVEYALDNGYSTVCKKGDEVLWCGLGLTLVNKSVFKAIGDPWFTTDHSYRIHEPFELEKIENPNKYGGQDINFCLRARELGYTTHVVPNMEAKHLRCANLSKGNTNSGSFDIKELPFISKRQDY